MRYLFTSLIAVMVVGSSIGCGKQTSNENNEEQVQQQLTVGVSAPNFTLADQDGKSHTLSDYKGKNVVLYFYPKNDTPGCTKEACAFRDDLAVFNNLNTVILGASVDDSESHKKFTDRYELNFTLLADVEKKVSESYGTLSIIGISKRQTFLIDKEGVIRHIYRDVNIEEHSKEIAEFIKQNMS